MRINKFTHKDYTINGGTYQLKLPLNIEYLIPEDESVRLLGQLVEEMNLQKLDQSYSRHGKNQATPRQMLKILLYAYMNHIYSARNIERACRRDINFMYLLEGKPAPDHATIARFRSLHVAPLAKELFAQFDGILADCGELSLENLFIDGTKIEAAANKYTFVWKKATTRNQQKLMEKIPTFFAQTEENFGIHVPHGGSIRMYHLKKLRRKLKYLQSQCKLVFVHGIGRKKSPLQRTLETLDGYLSRLKRYNQYLHIAGKRNSFSKTDHDATFMRMKEDAMRNGQLKPAYNIQFGVDSEYIVWVTEGPQPTDTTTLIPFLEEFRQHVTHKYKNVVADAGYESEENYLYLEKRDYVTYIKPANYEKSQTRSYRKDIGRRENMAYDAEKDIYTCYNGKKIITTGIRRSKSKTGYLSEKTMYACENCTGCSYKTSCIKGNNSKLPMEKRTKHFEVSKVFQEKRAEAFERIRSDQGKLLRMNRSIQAEGAFGEIKADMSFRRFLCRGNKNILAESMLLALAHNVNKLHNKIQDDRCGLYLHPLSQAG